MYFIVSYIRSLSLFFTHTTGEQLSTPPASTGSRISNNIISSIVLLIFRSSGNGTFRAAQIIGLASGFNLMEALAPFTVGSFSDAFIFEAPVNGLFAIIY